jgi:hypothetical protein
VEVRGQLHPPAALPAGKGPRWLLLNIAKFGGSQSRSERFRKEKILIRLMGIGPRFLVLPASSLFTTLTELTQLS